MKLKIAEVKTILDALLQLDGYDQIAKIKQPNGLTEDKVVRKPYDLSGKTRWNISKNITILSKKMEGFDKVKNDLIAQISEGKNIILKDETAKIKAFEKEVSSILEIEEEIDGLLKLTPKELKLDLDLDVNPFPNSVINPLMALDFIE